LLTLFTLKVNNIGVEIGFSSDGGLDWAAVDAILILSIEDYHG